MEDRDKIPRIDDECISNQIFIKLPNQNGSPAEV